MNKLAVIVGALMLLSVAASAQSKKKAPAAPASTPSEKVAGAKAGLKNYQDSVNYAIGMSVGRTLLQFNTKELDVNMISSGITDMLSENPSSFQLSEGQAMQLMQAYFMKLKSDKEAGELNKGKEFLAKNKLQEGVVELPSGLQYKIVAPGDANLKPKATDTVVVHYRGTLIDGKEFDSSYKRGEPISFPLDRVIPGWTEGVQLIGKGGKILLFVPSQLAYGERGAGRDIPGNAALIFEIELLDIKAAKN